MNDHGGGRMHTRMWRLFFVFFTCSAMLLLVLAISFMMSRKRTLSASDFFLSSSYPFFAPTRFVCRG